jgi:hypothetical protein
MDLLGYMLDPELPRLRRPRRSASRRLEQSAERSSAVFCRWACLGLLFGSAVLYWGTFGVLAGAPWAAIAAVIAYVPLPH